MHVHRQRQRPVSAYVQVEGHLGRRPQVSLDDLAVEADEHDPGRQPVEERRPTRCAPGRPAGSGHVAGRTDQQTVASVASRLASATNLKQCRDRALGGRCDVYVRGHRCSPAAPCSAAPPPAPRARHRRTHRGHRGDRPGRHPPGQLPKEVDVVVVGAGIAGLVAARKVARKGRSCSSSRPASGSAAGCSTTTCKKQGEVIESGGAFIGPTQTHIASSPSSSRCRRSWSTTPATASTCPRRPAGWSTPGPSRRTRRSSPDAALLLTQIDRYAAEIAVAAPWSHPRALEWDSMTLGEWIHSTAINAAGIENLIRCWTQPGFGADPTSSPPLHALVRRVLGRRGQRRHLRAQLRHRQRRTGAPVRRRVPADPAAADQEARRHRGPQGAGRAHRPEGRPGPGATARGRSSPRG